MFPALQRFFEAAGRIGGVLGDKTVVNLGCEEKKRFLQIGFSLRCGKKESDRMGYSPGKAPVCCNPAMGWEWLSPCMYPFWK